MLRLFDRMVSLFYPPRCVLCNRVLRCGEAVCEDCRSKTPRVDQVSRFRLSVKQKFLVCTAPYRYADRVRASILRFKFMGKEEYAPFYAEKLVQTLRMNGLSDSLTHVTCVPLSRKRQRKRGYNQAERIASQVAKMLSLPYEDTLEKVRENREQHKLKKKDRRENVRNVYRVLPQASVVGKRYLLVDDVVTTGSTISECAETLYRAGAAKIVGGAFASVW